MSADGQNQKAPDDGRERYRTGDLLVTHDGIPLLVLGAPDIGDRGEQGADDGDGSRGPRVERAQMLRLLRGTLVVLAPDSVPLGPIMLHVPTVGAGRPTFLSPWGQGWTPLPG